MKKISIIIPTKNEEKNIKSLIDSIIPQINDNNDNFEIIISDANSEDKTLEIISSYGDKIKVIPGGLPGIGRNNGAKISNSEYLLFIDADIVLSKDIIKDSLSKIQEKDIHLLTCKFRSSESLKANIIYILNNIIVKLSKFDKPFAIGGFFLIKKSVFEEKGGFDESLMHCEDYFLSKKVNRRKFYVIKNKVYTGDRRFIKIGFLGMIKYFIKNMINKNNINYFKNDIGYWKV